jgi:hypothetical protein
MRMVAMVLLTAAGMLGAMAEEPVHSALWGSGGEAWSPEGRLPDFSFAGYHRREAPIPSPPVTHNIRDFGAVGDGEHDDTEAFQRAVNEVGAGVILVPEGRYVIRKSIELRTPNLVLRGADRDKTILYCPVPLNESAPSTARTTGGQATSSYSWSGGILWAKGGYGGERLAGVTAPAARGASTFAVDDAALLQVGQEVEVHVHDDPAGTLTQHLYSDDPRQGIANLAGKADASLVARITAVDGQSVTIDRPLRFELRAEWQPSINSFRPTVAEVGIENLTFAFPSTHYGGHFTEQGFNAIAMTQVANCWVRNVLIQNADSGVFLSGKFCTLEGITFTSARVPEPQKRGCRGHHGIVAGDDNLITNFDFQTTFIHDLTVSGSAGSVFSNGKGIDLSLDHHCHAPHENLFTNIDAGLGTSLWRSGGGKELGAHAGARNTYWNIRAAEKLALPDELWGPWSLNFIGLFTEGVGETVADKRWVETIPPAQLAPQNLHEAQLQRRLSLR